MRKRYYHSAGKNNSVVECMSCGEPMDSIYDPKIRDTCSPCGGESKVKASPKRAERRRGQTLRTKERRILTAARRDDDDDGPRAA